MGAVSPSGHMPHAALPHARPRFSMWERKEGVFDAEQPVQSWNRDASIWRQAAKKGPRDLCVTSEHDCLMKHSYSLSRRYLESEKEWSPCIQHCVEDAWGRKRRKKFHPAWRALFLSPCMWILLSLSVPNNLIMTLLLHVCLWETQSCKATSTFHTTYLNTQSDLYIHEVMKDKWLLKLDCCDAAAKINSLMVVLRRFHPSTFFSL